MDLICDTNIWYNIGAGRENPEDLKKNGDRLIATPVNVIEISSKLTDRTLEERKDASQAIIEHCNDIMVDPEEHLASIWNLNTRKMDIHWMESFRAIANANSITEITQGVPDYVQGVARKVNVPFVRAWRALHYEGFVNDINAAIDIWWPGYADARRNGQVLYMTQAVGTAFGNALNTQEARRTLLLATRQRAALHLEEAPSDPSEEEIDNAMTALLPYITTYAKYLHKVATKFASRENDWGDLEAFIYLQDGNRLLTRDTKWVEIAGESGNSSFLANV